MLSRECDARPVIATAHTAVWPSVCGECIEAVVVLQNRTHCEVITRHGQHVSGTVIVIIFTHLYSFER